MFNKARTEITFIQTYMTSKIATQELVCKKYTLIKQSIIPKTVLQLVYFFL